MHPLLLFGILFNSALIVFNRFVKKLPDWVYISGQVICILAMIAGLVCTFA